MLPLLTPPFIPKTLALLQRGAAEKFLSTFLFLPFFLLCVSNALVVLLGGTGVDLMA